MKRVLSLLLSITVILSSLYALDFSACAYTYDNYTYLVASDGSITITKYNGDETEVTIPDEIAGKPVKTIARSAFNKCSAEKIITPRTLERVETYAFSSCENLIDITFFENLNFIAVPFISGEKLENITVDNNNKYYTDISGVLYNYSKTELLKYPNAKKDREYSVFYGTQIIQQYAFSYCRNLEHIEIPNTVKRIENNAFLRVGHLQELIIPDSVEYVGESAFEYCSWLKRIEIGSGLREIDNSAFIANFLLEQITVSPENEKFLSSNGILFDKRYTKLIKYPSNKSGSSYTIPEPIKEIAAMAFDDCGTQLQTVITNNVTKFGEKAFKNCYIQYLTVSEIVEDFNGAFYCWWSDRLKEITFLNPNCNIRFGCGQGYSIKGYSGSTAEKYAKEKGVDFIVIDSASDNTENTDYEYSVLDDNTAKITKYLGNDENVIIPSEIDGYKVTIIGAYAFKDALNISELTISDNVTYIDEGAFASCTNLKILSIPCSARLFCPSGIVVSSANQKKYSFYNCINIEKITVTKGTGVMIDYTSSSLPSSSDNPATSNSYYKCAPWQISNRLNEIVLDEGIEYIGKYAFYNCNKIFRINIPSSVTNIENTAFRRCSNLNSLNVDENNSVYSDIDGILYSKNKSIIFKYPERKGNFEFSIPDEVTTIATGAFIECDIKQLYIPYSVEVIEKEGIFKNEYLNNIVVSNDNKYYSSENGILYSKDKRILHCYPLGKSDTDFVIPYGVETIAEYTFYNNENLKSITLPESLLYIYSFAFFNCKNIKEIVIPKNVKYIGKSAFISCSSLNKITVRSYNCELDSLPFDKNSTLYACDGSTTDESYGDTDKFVSIGHNYVKTIIPPTCSEHGYTKYVCSVCENSYCADETLPADHQYDRIVIEPTCTEQGYTVYTCSKCDSTYTDDYTDALGHNIVIDKFVAATCIDNGLTQGSHCSICNEVFDEQKVIEATGHLYDNGVVTVKATCTKNGKKLYSCKNCNYSYSVSIDASGHKYVSKVTKASFTNTGKAVTSCSVCGVVKSKATIAKIKDVTLSKTSLIYTGKNLAKPIITVKDSKGKIISSEYYTVKYISRSNRKAVSNIKAIGQYKVKVTFKGKYSGTKELYFLVKPKKIAIKTPAAGSKYVIAKWTKDESVSGYQVVIAADSKFTKSKKVVTINKNSKIFYKFTKLKKGTKYYIKVRSYKTIKVDGRTAKMYSNYSTVKSIKCK